MTTPNGMRLGAVVLPPEHPVALPDDATDAGSLTGGVSEPDFPGWLQRGLVAYWKPLAMLLAIRMVTLGVLLASRYVVAARPVIGGAIAGGHRFDRLAAWDGGWYITAARYGWPHGVPMSNGFPAYSTLAFFPGFPLAIRVVGDLGVGWVLAGVLVAAVFQVLMVILMWQLFKEVWGEAVADRGMLLFLFGPGAVAFTFIYSEPMLFAAAAACMLALRRRWWITAGLASAIGTTVRPVGIALVACCVWEAMIAIRSDRDWRALAAPVLAPIGVVAWMGYLWAHTGNPLIWSKAEKAWDDSFDPLTLIERFMHTEVTHAGQRLPHVLPVAGAIFCLLALVLLRKARPPALFILYSVVVVAIAVSSRIVGLRPRLIETAFPLIFVFGYWIKGQVFSILLASAAVGLGCLLMLTLTSARFIP